MKVTLEFKEGTTRSEMLAQFLGVFGEPQTITGNCTFVSSPILPEKSLSGLAAGGVPFPTLHVDDNPASGQDTGVTSEQIAAVASGMLTAAQVFGGQPLPNAAPAFAGADQSATAHAAPTSMPPGFVPQQSAPLPGNAATALPGSAIPSNPAANANLDLDAEGLPWDERIHSSNHKKTDKGFWRAKRNVQPALESKVKAELLHTLSLGAAPTVAFDATQRPIQSQHVSINTLPGQIPNGANVPAPLPTTAQSPAAGGAPDPWVQFSVWVGGEIAAGRLTVEKVTNLAKLWGLEDADGKGSITLLAHKPDWIEAFKKALDPIPAIGL